MEPKTPEKVMKDIILEHISSGAVSVRPRFYFILQMVLVAVVALLVLLFSALLFNFVLFYLITRSHLPLLSFGPPGWLVFLYVFPWTIALLDALSIFVLWRLIRNFKVVYKNPVLYPLILILILVICMGSLVEEKSEVNTFAREQAHQGVLPDFFGQFFNPRHERLGSPGDAYRGIVEEVQQNSFTLLSTDLGTSTFTVVGSIHTGSGATLEVGDRVIVGGKLIENETIQAFGIRLLPIGPTRPVRP